MMVFSCLVVNLLISLLICLRRVGSTCTNEENILCNVSVVSQCNDKSTNTSCCSSINDAIALTRSEVGLCSGEFFVSIIFNSTSEILYGNRSGSSNTFSGNITQLKLLGATSGTVVECKNGTALTFNGTEKDIMKNPIDIHIHRMTFKKCGWAQNHVSGALLFLRYCHVELYNVTLEASNAAGLALVNVSGGVNISYSVFQSNRFNQGYGAGTHITILFDRGQTTHNKSSPDIYFTNCTFENNEAVPYDEPYFERSSSKGGGMYVAFSEGTHDVTVVLDSCTFFNNSAERGSGLHVIFSNNAFNNSMVIKSVNFTGNGNYNRSGNFLYSGGGGVMATTSFNSTLNKLAFISCLFNNNTASLGGGLQLFSAPSIATDREHYNHFNVSKCFFICNRGIIGAAIDVFCKSSSTSPEMCNTTPFISDCHFRNNGEITTVKSTFTTSTISLDSFPTTITGNLSFHDNIGSAIYVHQTAVILYDNTSLEFINNTAHNGAAVFLQDSWLTVSNNTVLDFFGNKALLKGGAICVYQTKEPNVPYPHECFIQYSHNFNPFSWESKFTFSGNTAANSNNSIFATSILPCVWHRANSTFDNDVKATFCQWKNWKFDNNCSNDFEVLTSAGNFSTTPLNVTMSPGVPKAFIKVVDDYGRTVSNATIVPTVWPPTSSYQVEYVDNSLIVFGPQYTNISILVQVDNYRNAFMTIHVSLGNCPPGFRFENSSLSCTCIYDKLSVIFCKRASWTSYITTGHCISYSSKGNQDKASEVVYGRCPFTAGLKAYNNHTSYIYLPQDNEELEQQFCGKFNRKGRLCGECAENYTIDIFSDIFQCIKCTPSASSWITYLAVEGLPPLVFFTTVILLHISLTSGAANGFVFYSQAITVSLEVITMKLAVKQLNIHDSNVVRSLMVDPYSIWSLDFFRIFRSLAPNYQLCLGMHLKVVHVLALRYFTAFYLLCFLVTAYILIEMHARNCRILVYLWKPLCFLCARFRQTWKAKTSVMDAFAAFILLSYVKIVRLSLLLTTFTNIYRIDGSVFMKVVSYDPTIEYLSLEHLPFVLIGAILLLTFGLIPPLLLTLYQFTIVQRCLNICKLNRTELRIFMDAFQGCYKDGKDGGPDRRYFAGLYFVFRFIIFAIYDNIQDLSSTYFLLLVSCITFAQITAFLQPYKKPCYNNIDTFFFNLLAVVMGLYGFGFCQFETTMNFSKLTMGFAYCLGFIPLIYMTGYVVTWLSRSIYYSFNANTTIQRSVIGKSYDSTLTDNSSKCVPSSTCTTYSEVTAEDVPENLANSYSDPQMDDLKETDQSLHVSYYGAIN